MTDADLIRADAERIARMPLPDRIREIRCVLDTLVVANHDNLRNSNRALAAEQALERAKADVLRVCRERNDTMKELRYAEGAYDQERRACKTYREQALALALERDKANAEIEARGERIHVMLDRALAAEQERDRWQSNENLQMERAIRAESSLARLQAECDRMREALTELVRINEQHNASVEAVIGRPLHWTDAYLNKARAALARTAPAQEGN